MMDSHGNYALQDASNEAVKGPISGVFPALNSPALNSPSKCAALDDPPFPSEDPQRVSRSRRAVDKTASRIERLNLRLLRRNQCIVEENERLRRQALLLSEENELLQKKLQEQVLFNSKSSGSK